MKDFEIFDPTTDKINKIADTKGNYMFALRENSNLPNVEIIPHYKEFRGNRVIYVGLAGSSLRTRDAKQHFYGNAGISTLRKSLGSLFGYKKVPRDKKDNGKTKFSDSDEATLTKWMNDNLVMYWVANDDYESFEQYLIDSFCPPLNLDKAMHLSENREFRLLLKKRRKNTIYNNSKIETMEQFSFKNFKSFDKTSGKYVDLWNRYSEEIIKKLKEGEGEIHIQREDFEEVGNRKSSGFGFRLDIANGNVPEKSGSAVARDLKKVLDENATIKDLLANKNVLIRLSNSSFILEVKVMD